MQYGMNRQKHKECETIARLKLSGMYKYPIRNVKLATCVEEQIKQTKALLAYLEQKRQKNAQQRTILRARQAAKNAAAKRLSEAARRPWR